MRRVAGVCVLGALIATCASPTPAVTPPASATAAPSAVSVGTTVLWINRGQLGHTVTARVGSFGSSTLDFGATFKFRFATPGRYPYYCMNHSDMTGEVVVR